MWLQLCGCGNLVLGLIIVTKSHLVYLEKEIADGRRNSTVSLSKLLAVKTIMVDMNLLLRILVGLLS